MTNILATTKGKKFGPLAVGQDALAYRAGMRRPTASTYLKAAGIAV
jgi:hypothetical protein